MHSKEKSMCLQLLVVANTINHGYLKSWVFGSDYFKQKISDKINRPIEPKQRGGDRKSGKFKNDPIVHSIVPIFFSAEPIKGGIINYTVYLNVTLKV